MTTKHKEWTPSANLTGLALRIRTSSRVKNVTLRMLPGQGLEVVVPPGVGQREIDRLLTAKQNWIERTASRLMAQGADLSGQPTALPEKLSLSAIGLDLPLSYATRPGALRLRENVGRLSLSGPVDDHAHVFRRLREYVREQAKIHLIPRLRNMSEHTGLVFDEGQVRCQRTRWGSCSKRGLAQSSHTRISLNAKLLFLPPALCDQVLLHELCHLLYQDHSPAYWAAVERINPQARQQERELSRSYRFIPPWWEQSF